VTGQGVRAARGHDSRAFSLSMFWRASIDRQTYPCQSQIVAIGSSRMCK
jgi:hypothetical protein